MRLRFQTMRERLEEEPEPDEPDEDEPATGAAASGLVPAVAAADGGREFEYRTELVTVEEVVDGTTLADRLTRASADGWDLVEIIGAGERHAILLRKAKRPERPGRPVGFAPPPS